MRLLLLEGDERLAGTMTAGLTGLGHEVDWVRDWPEAGAAVRDGRYQAMVLGPGLRDPAQLRPLHDLRHSGFSAPVLRIVSGDRFRDCVQGADDLPDDFVVHPFGMAELAVRLEAARRRRVVTAPAYLACGDVQVDPAARRVTQDGAVVELTGREYALLLSLIECRGELRSRHQLQQSLYALGIDIGSSAIGVHVHNIRRKLGRDIIRTVHGRGYIVDALAPASS